MRDPARIDEILELLGKVWRAEPDLRLGQLIYNVAREREPKLIDIFSIEDGVMRKGLMRQLERTSGRVPESNDQ